jgi:hypothetical protein
VDVTLRRAGSAHQLAVHCFVTSRRQVGFTMYMHEMKNYQ